MAINNNRYVTPDYTYRSNNQAGNTGSDQKNARKTARKAQTTTTPTAEPTTNKSAYSGFDLMGWLSSQAAARQAAADAAYEANMARIAEAYNTASGRLSENYDSTEGRLKAARKKSLNDVNVDAEKSLREAYVNNMMNRKDLNQRMAALGYNGGLTETTAAKLANQYGRARTDITNTLNGNISNLDQSYGDNLANALQAYNTALNNLDMQRMQMEVAAENARQNAIAQQGDYTSLLQMDMSYLDQLQNALDAQNQYDYTASSANNQYTPTTSLQAQAAQTGNNYAKLLQQMQLEASQGGNPKTTAYQAYASGAIDTTTLAQLLKQLGY